MRTMLKDHRFRTSKLAGGGERGQTLVEYALILLFVSTALVFTLGGLTSDIKATLESVVAGF